MDVHPATLTRWEQGHRPYTRQLSTIAAALGLDESVVEVLAGPAPRRPGRQYSGSVSALAQARLRTGLNRVELGRLLHVGPAAIYRWESGLGCPPPDRLDALARALGLTATELDNALVDHPPSRFDGVRLPGLGAVLRHRGVRRRQVRQLLGVSLSTVYEWESGRTRVPRRVIGLFADACQMEQEELVRQACAGPRPASPRSALAAIRRRAGMTQREAAAVLRLSPSTLSRYENGHRAVRLPLARRLARAYSVKLGTVLAACDVVPPRMLLTPTWTPEQLPRILADLRVAAGASKSQVARSAQVGHSTVGRWETGESRPSRLALATLEATYELSPGRLTALNVTSAAG
jgi:transcriptional regulator with XRE-family HTH domain